MQHILESELEDLKKSMFQVPGMSWVAPSLRGWESVSTHLWGLCALPPCVWRALSPCHLEGSGCLKSSSGVSAPSGD